MTDPVIIVGAGLAGISAALALAPLPVLLVSRTPLGTEASSLWAQGGIAAAVGPDDSPALHAADTMAAGDGLCDPAVVARITAAAPGLIAALDAAGANFAHTEGGNYALGLEAAHNRRRIVHAGDSTGAAVMRALIAQLRTAAHVTLLEGRAVTRLLLHDGTVAGVALDDGTTIAARRVVIATGGIGGLYAHTTNPRGAWGQGILLAARAGAMLADLEFVQFHPTALDVGHAAVQAGPMPLVSEAVRGEGAILIDESGTRFMMANGAAGIYPRAELEPRDVVSRAVWAHMQAGHRVWLDARAAIGPAFAAHFPAIAGLCRAAGIDPATQPIPIRPAVHYHMGGIATDADGRTAIPGLFAAGECAATGLHGANRLASNSLLEAAVCGKGAAAAILAEPAPALRAVPDRVAATPASDPGPVRAIMDAGLGVLRDGAGLRHAIAALRGIAAAGGPAADPATVALCIAISALRRQESRGAHARTDFPAATTATRHQATLADLLDETTTTIRAAA